jgi:ABC-type Fe3+-hydroxamate transport system substrate-binding protein
MKGKSALIFFAVALAGSASASFENASPQKAGLAIKDSLDRTVSIPARVERIISIQPEISRLIVALGAATISSASITRSGCATTCSGSSIRKSTT